MAARPSEQPNYLADNRGGDLAYTGASAEIRPQPDGSFSLRQLQRYLSDIRLEPEWRRDAETESAYYDGDQLETYAVTRMRELGIKPIVVNRIAPVIDSVAGLEVLTRSSLQMIPETEDSYDTAQGLNVLYKEAQRMTKFNVRTGFQYKEGLQIGISWLQVRRNPDPYGYPYEALNIPWREMFCDYRSRQPDYSDARFIVRSQWYDLDHVCTHFPKHAELLRFAAKGGGGTEGWLDWETLGLDNRRADLIHAADSDRRFTLEEDEWRQQQRGRLRLFEILYWVPKIAEVLRVHSTGRVVTLNRDSPLHLEALRRGIAEYAKGPTKQWRQAFFVGPVRLGDRALETNAPHYIPMVAYRRSSDGAPYGLTRRMRSAQEAINARYARLLYDLASRRIFVDEDAVDDHLRTAKELNKVTSYVVLKADRRGEQGIVLAPATDTTPITFQFLQEAKQNIYDATGLHPEFLGRTLEAGRSGVAIENLVEQTHQTLGGVVDNYREAKNRAGRQLANYLMNDMRRREGVRVETDSRSEGRARVIVLNARGASGERTNDTLVARMRVALAEAPDSVTYQQQKFQQLVEIVKSLPEDIQPLLVDLIVRAANVPHAEEILERIQSVTGFGPEPKDPQKRAELQQQKQRQAAIAEYMEELEMAAAAADVTLKEAQAQLEQAKVTKTAEADTDHTEAKTMHELAKAEALGLEHVRLARETWAKVIEAAAKLKAAAQKPAIAAAKPASKAA